MRTIATFFLILTVAILSMAPLPAHARSNDIVTTAVQAGAFKTLAAALQAADLVEALQGEGPFTVFAPTDEAFGKLPKGTVESLLKPENRERLVAILTYHVVDGKVPAKQVVKLSGAKTLNGQQAAIQVADGNVRVDNATVTKTDITCSNGIIHVIDEVLLPAELNIPATAQEAGQFKTLLAAVGAAGLAEVLAGEGPFTVFAPTDDAFAKLPKGTVENLLRPENKQQLIAVLKYHVVPGRIYSTDALAVGAAKTLQGGSISITRSGGTARVNDAQLLATDLDASNGVIHVIDSVMLPPKDGQAALHPREMIRMAINTGAPQYNAGHHGRCASTYMTTVSNLLQMEDHGMSAEVTQHLQTAMKTAQHSSCATSRAWTLRRALDAAYSSMASIQ